MRPVELYIPDRNLRFQQSGISTERHPNRLRKNSRPDQGQHLGNQTHNSPTQCSCLLGNNPDGKVPDRMDTSSFALLARSLLYLLNCPVHLAAVRLAEAA